VFVQNLRRGHYAPPTCPQPTGFGSRSTNLLRPAGGQRSALADTVL